MSELESTLAQLVEDYCKSAKEDVVIWLADHPEAKQRLTQMVKEIIGPDGTVAGYTRPNGMPSYNLTENYYSELRQEQRARARKYGLEIENHE